MEKVNIYLSKPAILTSLGEGIEQHIQMLNLHKGETSLAKDNSLLLNVNGETKQSFFVGSINKELKPFPQNLPQEHKSRNNQLLWHALEQIDMQIKVVIEKYGHQRVGVVIGTSTTGVDENIPVFKKRASENNHQKERFNQQQQYFNAPADFIAHQYHLKNVVYGISTACTSSARALITGARLLKAGICDAVICGGGDTLSPLTISGFNSLSVLSDEQTKPFSQNRKGINIGEGVALFVLTKEPLFSDIKLLGYGASSDAYHMSSPHPEGKGAVKAFEEALKQAHCQAEDIGWINAHGTGTLQNDQMEMTAINKIFSSTVPVTSTKAYTGHTLGAAGAVEAAISWGVVSRDINPQGILPAQFQIDEINQEIEEKGILLTNKKMYWEKKERIVASSSFAFGGNNAVLILGEKHD